MNKTTLENWEAEFDDEFTYFDENGGQYILGGYDEKTRLNTDCIPEIKNFIKDLLASSQKDKEKAVEEIYVSWDTAEAKDNWVVQFWQLKQDGTRVLLQELNKDSDSGGAFKLESLKSKKE